MKKVILLTLVALLPVACSRHKSGPGASHETTQTIGREVLPFDDRLVVRELLRGRSESRR